MKKCVAVLFFCLTASSSFAHQPVMDMAPRWEKGWGFQVRHEYRYSDELILKDDVLSNPLGLERKVNTTWLESVYTFDRSKRVTVKVPWVDQKRVVSKNGVAQKQRSSGLGDLILGVPLKSYSNRGGFTNNFGFTPSLRIPTGKTNGDYPISDGSVDVGLSFSYSGESSKFYQLYDLFYWINNKGNRNQHEGNQVGLDINWGWHPYHDNETDSGMFIMTDISARYKDSGTTIAGSSPGTRVSLGPVLVLYKGNMMFRAEYKIPVYEYALEQYVSYGNEVNVGIGWAF